MVQTESLEICLSFLMRKLSPHGEGGKCDRGVPGLRMRGWSKVTNFSLERRSHFGTEKCSVVFHS